MIGSLSLPAPPGLLAGRPVGLLGHGDRTKSRDAPDLSGAIRERPGLREAGQPRTAPRTNPTPTAAARSELWQLGNLAGQSPRPFSLTLQKDRSSVRPRLGSPTL